MLLLTGCGKKGNADLIVGKWELVKGEEVPAGSVMEFTKDGKMKVTMTMAGKEIAMEGTYKVEGEKLTTSLNVFGKEISDTDTIKTLNETMLILENTKGKVTELKRKKK